MKKFRVATLGLVAAFAMVWAFSASAASGASSATVIKVTAGKPSEFGFILSAKKVKMGTVTFVVKNSGAIPHDFKILGKKTRSLNAGQSQSITVKFTKAGKFPFICTLPSHAVAGMKGTLTVIK
jgi:uncharacterized cupredoxin-like copper-binding protein